MTGQRDVIATSSLDSDLLIPVTDWLASCNVKVKGKGKCMYIALIFVVHARRSGMNHTVLPAITPMPAFTS